MSISWLFKHAPKLKYLAQKIGVKFCAKNIFAVLGVVEVAVNLGNIFATKENTVATRANTTATTSEAGPILPENAPPGPPNTLVSWKMAGKCVSAAGSVYAGYQLHSFIMDENQTIKATIETIILVAGQAYMGFYVLGGPATVGCLVGGYTLSFAVRKWQQS